ncbi:MAG: elongation factor P [Deltaproteobacteria bacterium]|nr:MAG: elongation factor P [Deltaproteobacteria bacterium]
MALQYDTSDFRNGLKIELDGQPYIMTYFQFVKPGKGTAFTRTKLKNMITGAVIERTFRSGEKVDAADVEDRPMQFLYEDGEFYHFMNTETYEQVAIPADALGDEKQYLTENIEVTVLFYKGRAVSLELPNFIEDVIEYCEPGVRGNTATGATKPATLACGAQVLVPLFVEQGEKIRVDTRTNQYVSRVKD